MHTLGLAYLSAKYKVDPWLLYAGTILLDFALVILALEVIKII